MHPRDISVSRVSSAKILGVKKKSQEKVSRICVIVHGLFMSKPNSLYNLILALPSQTFSDYQI